VAGGQRQGFIIERIEAIPELRVTAYQASHEKTGAALLHLHCEDRENLFSIGFRTPPQDSTGVPHILEHSVLAGSERYPLKDVFNELMRGTLQTFLNAFTYPDKTIYPVASQERRDFFNLARVYLDLVLRPRLSRETFLQEGHHLDFAPDGRLILSGIVYNEMKGVYSTPDALMYKALQENLYPDTPYACDSGGDPRSIPDLTYEQFKTFHRTYYSPTNARFFLYGDIPTEEHLRFLADELAGFERVAVDSAIALQPRWSTPRAVRGTYPCTEGQTQAKTTVNLGWMTAESRDSATAMLLTIVADLLVGSAASPLRKALIDSGLGEDLSPVTGLERDFRQIAFAVGLRGTEADRAERIEALILDKLQEVQDRGFDRELIEGTLHQIEFHGREKVRSAYPYGIVLMGRAYRAWLYDGDPLADLNFPRLMTAIRRNWEADPALFQKVVEQWLLGNPHRLLSVLEPNPAHQTERERETEERLSRLQTTLSEEAKAGIRADAAAVKRFQEEPDPPEAIATLPKLSIADISQEIDRIPSKASALAGVPSLSHELFTNGICYLDLAFDVSDIPDELQPCLPLLGKLTCEMGAADLSYEAMAKRISLRTGGLGAGLATGLTADGKGDWQYLTFSLKTLERNVDEALEILMDLLTAGDLTDQARMRDLIREKKNGLHASVIPSGHLFAQMAATAGLFLSARRNEQWHGRTQLRYVTAMAEQGGSGKESFRERLQSLRTRLFTRSRLRLNLTAEAEGLQRLATAAARLAEALPAGRAPKRGDTALPASGPIGIAIPSQVSYVAKVLAAPPYEDPLAPALFVLARQLSNGSLYRRIRVQGGAYGGFCRYEPLNGLFAFLSYRDPHLVETLDVYRQVVDGVVAAGVSQTEAEKAVIGAIASLDKPQDPRGRGYTALIRDFAGLTDIGRLRFRNGVLAVQAKDLQKAARRFLTAAVAAVAVCASEERLRQANETLAKPLQLETL